MCHCLKWNQSWITSHCSTIDGSDWSRSDGIIVWYHFSQSDLKKATYLFIIIQSNDTDVWIRGEWRTLQRLNKSLQIKKWYNPNVKESWKNWMPVNPRVHDRVLSQRTQTNNSLRTRSQIIRICNTYKASISILLFSSAIWFVWEFIVRSLTRLKCT